MNDENLDLLDLDDTEETVEDTLPDAEPFVAPRPHRPWLLMGLGLAVIILAVFVIVRVVSNNSSSSMEVNLDTPVVSDARPVEIIGGDVEPQPMAQHPAPMPAHMPPPPAPGVAVGTQPMMPAPAPAPVVAQPVVNQEPSVRVVQDRKEVKFEPVKAASQPKPIVKPAPKQVKTATKPKTAPKATIKTTTQKVSNGGWYVQFGSYGTREAANAAEKKIRAEHKNLFGGKQFVVLAAVLPNGQTTYRLRIAFATADDAGGFCRNAKSDGLDCYVAK